MENLSTDYLMSLVNLTLIDGEGIHYHFDPETQFYNQCHSQEDGKFCGSKGAKVDPYRRKLKIKTTHVDQTKTGEKVFLLDRVGKQTPKIEESLKVVTNLQNIYKIPTLNGVIVHENGSKGRIRVPTNAMAWVFPLKPDWIHSLELDDTSARFDAERKLNPGTFMSSAKRTDPTKYMITHEFGHIHYLDLDRKDGKSIKTLSKANALWYNPSIKKSLSGYGKSNLVEAYAEAFAEWHLSGGKTRNLAANTYAKTFGWKGASKLKDVAASTEATFALDQAINMPVTENDLDYTGPVIIDNWELGPKLEDVDTLPEPTEEEAKEVENTIQQILSDANSNIEFTMEASSILSLVDLRIIFENDGTHYHLDPVTQFYNQCHSTADGKFCTGNSVRGRADLRDSDGRAAPVEGPVKHGKLGGSLVDPHEGTATFDGVKGYDKKTGKPVPGTDAWLENHGLSRQIFDSRPYVKFEATKTDPALHEAFARGTPGAKQWDRLAGQEGQEGGYIMYKHPIPDSPYGEIEPQVRPNEGAITNYANRKKAEVRLANAKQRYIDLKTKITPADLIAEQKANIKKSEINLERTKTATPELIRTEAKKDLENATSALVKAKESKDPDKITQAKKDLAAAKRNIDSSDYKANKFKPESAIYHAEKQVDSAKQRLADIQEDPKGFLAAEIIRQGGKDGKGGRIARAENAYKGEKAKYLFTKDGDVARIDINPDKQNVKNLTETKGRIYFAMEGSIKNDAVLAAIKREDPTASVVNVPSVTLWHNKTAGEGEIQWFARTHGKDRQIVLIPDADGVNNVNVMRQANALAAALKNGGAKQVLVAAPPVKHGTKNIIDPVKLVSKDSSGKDVYDERKGIDDHLGAGRGTLGQLAYQTDAKIPKFSLSYLTRGEGNTETGKLNKNGVPNAEKMLGAISGLAGKKGAVQVSKNLLMQTSGITSPGSAIAARDKLADLGIIDIHYVFDKDVLYKSRKRVLVMPQKEVDHWVSQKIIKPLPEDLFAKDDYEASPVIVIKNPKYIVKEENSSTGVLSDLPDWKPPKTYSGWSSPLTGKKDTTGIAERLVVEEAKTKAKAKGITPTGVGGTTKSTSKNSSMTAEKRLSQKKAPAGRQIVRTDAGAKKYGVKIGDLVPLSADPGILTSMVLLSSVLSEEDLVEFYNSCHGQSDGKFCEGKDGPGSKDNNKKSTGNNDTNGKGNKVIGKAVTPTGESGQWPSKSGRPVTETYRFQYGVDHEPRTVDGVGQVKAQYEVTTVNGENIRLLDKTGLVNDRQANNLLQNHARMQEMYHLSPPRSIIVSDSNFGDIRPEASASVWMGNDDIYTMVNYNHLDRSIFENSASIASNGGKGWHMPSGNTGDPTNSDYTMTHEFGHQVDGHKNWDSRTGEYHRSPLTLDPSFNHYMSRYANTDPNGFEAYAESFADWHHSNGTTTNPGSIAMAEHEGWNGNRAGAFERSGRVNNPDSIGIPSPPPGHYDETPAYGPGFSILSMVALADRNVKTEKYSVHLIDGPDGPVIEGNYSVVDPSKTDIEAAKQIMDRVLKTEDGSTKLSIKTEDSSAELTVLDQIESNILDTEEFYNQCHDEHGQFCPGHDGPGRVRDNKASSKDGAKPVKGKFGFGNSHIRTVAETQHGHVEVDGVQAKAVYEATADDGQTIRLYDKTGKVGNHKDELLNNHVRMHNLYPLQPPSNIVVVEPDSVFNNSPVDQHSFATVYGDDHTTYVNVEKLNTDIGRYKDGFQMPSAKTGNTKNLDYLLTHEYGHHVDFDQHSNNGYSYDKHPLYNDPSFRDHLSTYGRSDDQGIEAYAETFAEWHHSGGHTQNPSAIAMARYEGWVDPSGLYASGETRPIEMYIGERVNLTLQNSVHLRKDEVMNPSNEENMYTNIPKSKGIRISDTFTEDGPVIDGDYKVIEPSKEEITKASEIMAAVLKELGLEK